jgi:hypothetical protein
MPEKITLTEAFRVILRATYLQRPALADEIQSNQYFHCIPINRDTGSRDHPEAQAASDALDMLKNAIVGKRVRVCGRLGGNLPAEINPMEMAEVDGPDIKVFDGTIEIHEHGRTLRTYQNVHCYEHEIKAILNIGLPKRVGARPKADWDAVETALRLEIKSRGMIGPDNDTGWQIKGDVERWVSSLLEARNEVVGESTVRNRVSRMLESIEAGN